MDIDISWSLIFKAALAWLGVYLLSPALLIARDKILWWAVDRWLLNSELREAIVARVAWENRGKDKRPPLFSVGQGEATQYYSGDRQLSRAEYLKAHQLDVEADQKLHDADGLIARRRANLDTLFRYFKQPPELNPIDRWISEQRAVVQKYTDHINSPAGAALISRHMRKPSDIDQKSPGA